MMNQISIFDVDDEEIMIEKEWIEEGVQAGQNCLVGRMLMKKPYSVEGVKIAFSRVWHLQGGLSISVVGDHLFLFQFEDAMERDRVLLKQPLMFSKYLIVFQEFDSRKAPEDINLDWYLFRYKCMVSHWHCRLRRLVLSLGRPLENWMRLILMIRGLLGGVLCVSRFI
ncbi:hypothetical protein PTKIN_Ptkin10aG0053100 [Pterospermum kingtungense]